MASPKKKKPAPVPAPAPPPAPVQSSLLYVIGFSLAVFCFVVGVYQTLVEQDLAGNYWLFMIALGLLFGLRWLRLRQTDKSGQK